MDKNTLRPVEVDVYDFNLYKINGITAGLHTGYFHQFISTQKDIFALVELECGFVAKVEPERIRFLDR